jgi:hypothetical protein
MDPVAPDVDVAISVGAKAHEAVVQGAVILGGLPSQDECDDIASLYPEEHHFRSRVIRTRHGFGKGRYRYNGPAFLTPRPRRGQLASTASMRHRAARTRPNATRSWQPGQSRIAR